MRRQAKDLLRAARAGDPGAVGEIRAVSDRLALASAQLAVARAYGVASWSRLATEDEAFGRQALGTAIENGRAASIDHLLRRGAAPPPGATRTG